MPRRVVASILLLLALHGGAGLRLAECASACGDEGPSDERDCGLTCCRTSRADLGRAVCVSIAPRVSTASLDTDAPRLPLPEPREILHVPKPPLL